MDSKKPSKRRKNRKTTAEALRPWVGMLVQVTSAVVLVLRYLSGC